MAHHSSDGISRLGELMRYEQTLGVPESALPAADPRLRRRRRRRAALIAGLVAVVLAASAGGYSAWALTAPIGTAELVAAEPVIPVPEPAALDLGGDVAAGAISLVSGGEGYLPDEAHGTWAARGDDTPRPMASITKLITALVILDAKPLAGGESGPTIAFGSADVALYDKYYVLGASIAEMPRGSSLSQHDALEAMLIVSACNYAEALSTWAYGSQSAFLGAARSWLAANGLSSTTIVEPTGLDARNTSTPTDLLALGRLAMAHPVIAEISAMSSLAVPTIPAMLSTNTLLGLDGVTGLKTGTLEETGANLLFTATVDVGLDAPLVVVGVMLGGYTRESVNLDVRGLLASIRSGFHPVELGVGGQEVGTYSTPWGESAAVVLDHGASVLTWSDTPVSTTFRIDPLTSGEAGDVVGEITWTVGGSSQSVPLVLSADVEPPDAWWRLTHPSELG
jgi:D-alanyl-D-alanine carboxypeptidase (penicillin-binding protein 5/6)